MNEQTEPDTFFPSMNPPHEAVMNTTDILETLSRHIYLTNSCSIFYSLFMLLSLVCLALEMYANHIGAELKILSALELMLTFFLTIEVVFQIFIYGKRYFSMWIHWFDFTVVILSLLGCLVFLLSNHKTDGQETELEEINDISTTCILETTCILILRYAVQILRVQYFIRGHQKQLSASHAPDLNVLDAETSTEWTPINNNTVP
eukprot:CAMPEP_0115016114 /NCGR_PEP_ID=MMETSP0216-20121206/27216_1 /TAXON_ID=223996 /ORGANISM="Protocruzia adherens, Strain Boccale" /LENGTH=203 /DNA_ID=CAMNT_0002386453 /DNA_START=57 /DNA_END=664 /DNA_ORIENTATION=+